MAQYATVILRTKSEKAPDFGLGQGIIATKSVRLSDNDIMAGIQMNEVWEEMVEENFKMDYKPATEEDWNNAKE
jgi:hypothetical protein